MSTAAAAVIAEREGAVGHLTLNRPKAINALTLEMVRLIDTALTGWETDAEVLYVLLDGAGERGFCAGGDIVVCADATRTRELGPAQDFWREEYWLNTRIARYAKPIVAIMDGIVMGGGVGLASHASHRLGADRTHRSRRDSCPHRAPARRRTAGDGADRCRARVSGARPAHRGSRVDRLRLRHRRRRINHGRAEEPARA